MDGSIHHKMEHPHEHEDVSSEGENAVQRDRFLAAETITHRRPVESVQTPSQNLDEFTGQNDGGEQLEMSLNGELVPSSPQVTTPRSNVYPTYTKADLFLVTLALLAMLVMFACCAWIGCCMNNTEDASERTASEVNLVGRSWGRCHGNLEIFIVTLPSTQP